MPDVSRRLVAEALGAFFLLAAVVGSGVMAERLAGGNVAIALLGNTNAERLPLCRELRASGLTSRTSGFPAGQSGWKAGRTGVLSASSAFVR